MSGHVGRGGKGMGQGFVARVLVGLCVPILLCGLGV